MLPVYICEDEEQMRNIMKVEVGRQILIHNYDMEIVLCTEDPQELLDAVKEQKKRGVYFLDVDLKNEQLDGFTLGHKIRQYDSRGFLVYVTSYGDLAFKTFEYHLEALDYIKKGQRVKMVESIRSCLESVIHRLEKENSTETGAFFTLKTMDTIKMVPVSDILFFETSPKKHRLILHTSYERFDFIGKLADIKEQLGDLFIYTHRSYLVKKTAIKDVDMKQGQVTLQNGQSCLLSRKMKNIIRDHTFQV